jgi:hypothetical protein
MNHMPGGDYQLSHDNGLGNGLGVAGRSEWNDVAASGAK